MKLRDQMMGLAEEIIDRMSREFEPEKFEDRYENAMIEFIRSSRPGCLHQRRSRQRAGERCQSHGCLAQKSIEAGGGKAKEGKSAGKRAAEAPKKRAKKAG